jgi:hypothetical protein
LALLLSGCTNQSAQDESNAEQANSSSTAENQNQTNNQKPADSKDTKTVNGAKESAAANYLENQLKEYDNALYVFKDFDDGANYYTQKAWAGSNNINIPAMHEDVQGYKGVSGIACELDLNNHSWGGYMFVNGILRKGETVPVIDFGENDARLDLSGATTLTFYAKGELGNEYVDFFIGGLGADFDKGYFAPYLDSDRRSINDVALTKEWQRYEIPLENADMSEIACGFGWSANRKGNPDNQKVRFYLDEIRYEFKADTKSAPAEADRIVSSQAPMFLQSYASADLSSDDSVINNFAYLYDQSITAMALSYAGKHERARQIADAIVYAQNHDRYYTDGRLRNAYAAGNPKSFPGWFSNREEEFARLPGFYDIEDGMWYEDAYSISAGATGNYAWAILALCEVYDNAPNRSDYLTAAKRLADYILTLKGANDGFLGGYDGWEGSEVPATYLSTEHNTDLITAFGRLYKLTGEQKYASAQLSAKKFVLSMYDVKEGCFYTGTMADGVTPNKEVVPLDCQTWTIMALGDEFADAEKVLNYVEKNMALDNGYDFNTDKDGVWFEGTAQAALAYLTLGDEAQYKKILDALNKSSGRDGSITAADRDGVSTGFMVSGSDMPWNYGKRTHIGATAWLAFAQLGVNPLAY